MVLWWYKPQNDADAACVCVCECMAFISWERQVLGRISNAKKDDSIAAQIRFKYGVVLIFLVAAPGAVSFEWYLRDQHRDHEFTDQLSWPLSSSCNFLLNQRRTERQLNVFGCCCRRSCQVATQIYIFLETMARNGDWDWDKRRTYTHSAFKLIRWAWVFRFYFGRRALISDLRVTWRNVFLLTFFRTEYRVRDRDSRYATTFPFYGFHFFFRFVLFFLFISNCIQYDATSMNNS